ncbi:hypothetical protein GTO10_03810 [Candidatus Saccharibacteria bacterium]|nr:hypothetical protein [Candidatus Saccharibacteria bacterium]
MSGRWFSIILGVLAILGAAAIVFFFFEWDIRSYLATGGEPTNSEDSTSQNTLLSVALSGDTDLTQQTAKLKAEGFKDNYIVADITSIDKSGDKLGLNINLPSTEGFETQDVTATTECTTQNTTSVSRDDYSVLSENAELFEEVEVGDVLWAYCLDDSCGVVGRECVLVKVTGEE